MPQNNFWGCKLPDFHLLTGKTPFLRLLEKIQSPYTLLAAFPRTWYNREESHLGQLEFFSGCSFLIALNMILHLRIISQFRERGNRQFFGRISYLSDIRDGRSFRCRLRVVHR